MNIFYKNRILLFLFAGSLFSCKQEPKLHPVSVEEFSTFIKETAYKTDAEKYGWSIIQENVYDFRTEEGATWQIPDAVNKANIDFPVTQVSYNDALAYCKWAGARLPTYEEFWKLTNKDTRPINEDASAILPLSESNIIGNVWDLTSTHNEKGEIRLAGGSYMCNPYSCNGTHRNRVLFVDKTTGNIHIGFSVISHL